MDILDEKSNQKWKLSPCALQSKCSQMVIGKNGENQSGKRQSWVGLRGRLTEPGVSLHC